jgi:hypothetical protein
MTQPRPTLNEIREWPATCDVVSAGAALGIGRNGTYDALKAGEFPVRVLKIGHRYRCVTAELIALLEASERLVV